MAVVIRKNEIKPLIAILEASYGDGLDSESPCYEIDELLERLLFEVLEV